MLNRYKTIAAFIIACAAATASCSSESPESVATSYVRALASGNSDAVMRMVSFSKSNPSEIEEQKNNIRLVTTMIGNQAPMHGGLISVKVDGTRKIDETHIAVDIVQKFGDGTTIGGAPTLVKENGKWLVVAQ